MYFVIRQRWLCGALTLALMPVASLGLADWPSFRGADRSAVAPDKDLLTSWPKEGPELLWDAAGAGRGYATPTIADGKLYTLGDALSVADDKDEYLTCFDIKDGKQLWKLKTGRPWADGPEEWQSARSTPTVDGKQVFVITAYGQLICATTDGKKVWEKDLMGEFGGTKADSWGYSESPTVDGDLVVVTPGAEKNTMVALNRKNGKLVWSCSRPGDIGAGHASIVKTKVGKVDVYVTTTGSGAMGVRAKDGKLLWTYNIDKTTAVIPTPIAKDEYVFFTAGYKRGGALLKQVAKGNDVKVEEVYELQTNLANKHGGVVRVGDLLFGDSDDAGAPFCADMMTGEVAWKKRGSGRGSASVAAADGHVYIRYSDGVMTLVKASRDGMEEVGSFKPPRTSERPSWAHPVIDDGKLYLREGDHILCYSLK